MKAMKLFAATAIWGTSLVFLPSCAPERPPEVPANAQIATSGQDRLSYTAPEDGTIWVYEVNANRIVYSGTIERKQVVLVDTMANKITIDDKVVSNKDIDHGPTYKVFFQATDRD